MDIATLIAIIATFVLGFVGFIIGLNSKAEVEKIRKEIDRRFAEKSKEYDEQLKRQLKEHDDQFRHAMEVWAHNMYMMQRNDQPPNTFPAASMSSVGLHHMTPIPGITVINLPTEKPGQKQDS